MAQVIRPLRAETSGGRVPPHNLEAEESVLGSMMLSRNAVSEVLEVVHPQDFYREAHEHICQGILDLFSRGEPIDAITVGDELQRRGVIEQIGGAPYLLTLVSSVPTAANAAFYARIVAEHATLRRLIDAATTIAQNAYEVPDDIESAINRAEEAIYAVSQRRISSDFVHIREMLAESMDQLEHLATRTSDVTGVPTGFADLDDLTSGLQPGNMVIVAARPAMGKSSLVMNVAHHVALTEQLPVVVFSLEMSWMEIVQRLICAEARVDTKKLRTGHLSEADWMRVSNAAGRLAEAKLYIDDTPSISMMEVRAKCRRLASKPEGLKLVIVDYIQLMQSSRRIENRVQEVAEISRSLKILAKELDVPVIGVSQLSRNPEQAGRGGDRRPRLADLRECVTGDTLVCLTDGRRVPISSLLGTTPHVLAMSREGRIVEALADKVWKVGTRQTYLIRLVSGRQIRATGKHRLLGARGWVRIDRLMTGDRLAAARRLPEPSRAVEWPWKRVGLLAHLIGDGSYVRNLPMRYTTASEENSAFVDDAVRTEFGCAVRRRDGPTGTWHQLEISGNGNRWHPAGVNAWLRELGIHGQRSREKRVPEGVFQLMDEQVAHFLQHLWATDGTIAVRKPDGRGGHGVNVTTVSEGLAADIVALLLRLGINARIHRVRQVSGSWYSVAVSGAGDQRRFLSKVGAFGPRREAADRLAAALEGVLPNTNVDTLPVEVFDRVRASMNERGISQREMTARRGTAYGGSSHFRFAPSRGVVAEYAEILEDDELWRWATNDIFWDKVAEIEPAGEEDVYDLTVPGPASWLADGLVSHNSGALEQDSDLVMFVYRDEVYNQDTTKKGEAELIVAKHRNGPIGTIDLAFLGQYTKFADLARP